VCASSIPEDILNFLTKVYYGLYQFQHGSCEDDLPFSGNIFGAVYKAHAASLAKMAEKTPNKFLRIMLTLFELAGYVLSRVAATSLR
jgi:hypothetical protein